MPAAPRSALAISDETVVSLHYRLVRSDGSFVEAYTGKPAFRYLHGAGNVVPGLERELAGRHAGDRLQVTVLPEHGYGVAHDDYVQSVPRSMFPRSADLRPGLRFGSDVDGMVLPAWVTEVTPHSVTVSFNHPLAGETLHFAVEIVKVRPALRSEVSRGRPRDHSAAAG